jgi:hypothetical protein
MDREPAVRAVLLGASNLKAGLPTVLDGIRRHAAGPVEALVACGHGRSYGTWSRFLFVRSLPGIAGCGLWRTLSARPPLRTLGLITDVGNDLAYGASVEQIAGWVAICLDRLARQRAEIVLTLLPLARLEKLSGREVRLASALLFPGRGIPWPGLLERARELDTRLRQMGRDRGAQLVEPAAHWYGIDPIHFRRRARREVWARILSHWDHASAGRHPLASRVRIPLLGAEELRLAGFPLRTAQPAVRLADGTTLELY